MADLIGSLNAASNALDAFQQAITVTQNNVTNANTPGYAKQVPVLQALPFDQVGGQAGGSTFGAPQNTRNEFAENAVRQQTSLLGTFQQIQTSLQPLQTVFDATGQTGISKAFNDLYSAFSAWSTEPTNSNTQTGVLSAAGEVADAFQQAASQVNSTLTSTNQDLQSTVNQINQAAQTIQNYNIAKIQSNTPDPNLDANLNSTLENLSQLANIQVVHEANGTVGVLLGGQTPLVLGNQVDPLKVTFTVPSNAQFPGNPPVASIVDSNGNDITSEISGGSLSGLLSVRNGTLPSLIGSPSQAGNLNTLAKSFADAVNSTLTSGQISTGPPPVAGVPLFTYGAGSNVAASLTVNAAITPGQLAAIDPGPPLVSNGTALKLANLDSNSTTFINGLSFSQFFSSLATDVGNQISSATSSASTQTQVVAQAKAVRSQLSGVSLDEEAVRIVQLQTAFDAVSKVVTVIDQLAQTLVNIVQ